MRRRTIGKAKALIALSTLSVGLAAGTANAVQYVDLETVGQWMGSSLPNSSSYTGSFSLISGNDSVFDALGFDPVSEQITSAIVGFNFYSYNSGASRVNIDLDGQSLVSNGSVTAIFTSFNNGVTGSALLTLNATGSVSYEVNFVSGEPVFFSAASLMAEAGAKVTVPVPDSGMALSFFGLSLLGLGLVSRFDVWHRPAR
jgi:hypothetical protein